MRNHRLSPISRSGFTLVELLVTTAIFAIITGVILVSNQRFNSSILISSLAYDVALTVRQAQSYGINTRGSGGSFDRGYGVRFDIDTPKSYILFVDINGNNQYDSGEEIETFSIKRGNKITQLCGNQSGSPCDTTANTVDIVFKRPDPDAVMIRDGGASFASTEIHLISPQSVEKIISIESTGQISIQNP